MVKQIKMEVWEKVLKNSLRVNTSEIITSVTKVDIKSYSSFVKKKRQSFKMQKGDNVDFTLYWTFGPTTPGVTVERICLSVFSKLLVVSLNNS